MKIAYIYDAVYPWVKGGAEKRIYELSRRLADRGHEVHCYGMKWWPGKDDIIVNGVHLHGICKPMPLYSKGKRSMKQAAYFACKALSIDADCDVLDCQNFPYLSCFSARWVCGWKKEKLFITWHEVWGDYWYQYLGRKGAIGRRIEKAVCSLTDNHIAVSERTRKDLEELGVRGAHLIPNGIDFKRIEQVKASEKESDIIYAGRLVEHKNVDMLIRAVRLLKRDAPDVRAVIVGDGPEMGRLKALARELGLEKNMEFTGFVENYDDALALMKASSIFVSPSTREGFGIAALEANACGLPVVTVRHHMNAVCDLVTEETGVICSPTEDDLAVSMAEKLDAGWANRDLCIDLARGYDWERICDLVEKVYETEG